jgi:hypothetical protein
MIFRDKKTGNLLNIRIEDYPNDRLYFQEIIGVLGGGGGGGGGSISSPSPSLRRYSTPFDDIHHAANAP